MSIWKHLTDIELADLKEAREHYEQAAAALQRVRQYIQEEQDRLRSVEAAHTNYRAATVTAGLGGAAAAIERPGATVEEVKGIITELQSRQAVGEQAVKQVEAEFNAKYDRHLRSCIERATESYCAAASAFMEQWRDLNAAQLALGNRDLSWIHCLIPAVEGMSGGQDSYGVNALFDGRDEPFADDGMLKQILLERIKGEVRLPLQ